VAADLQLLIPENQELFNAGMDGDLVAATLENLRVYNPRERTELESQLLRDTGTEFTNSQDLADPLTDLPLNWAEVETAEKRLKATGGGSLSDPNTEVPLIVQKPSGQIRTLFSTHPALSPLGRLASFWREMPLWQRLLLAALVAVWTICLLIACSVIIFRKSGV
jgi:hypothetical protein